MVRKVAPAYAHLGIDLIVQYFPPEDRVSSWHLVKDGRKESLKTISDEYQVAPEKLMEFNFPGSVRDGHINPDVVNWYLFFHKRFLCRTTTKDGFNYRFNGGETVAIPWLGHLEIGEPEIIRSRNTVFKIRMHANLNASLIAAADFSIFEIWDEKAGLCSFYTYWAGGVAAGIKGAPWLSATFKGPWNEFKVTRPIGAHEFGGATRFTTGGVGSHSKNYINFMSLPNGSATEPNPLPISTGFTLGAGVGTSVGNLSLFMAGEPDGLLPFKGD